MASPDGISLSASPAAGRQTDAAQSAPVAMPNWLPLLLGFLTLSVRFRPISTCRPSPHWRNPCIRRRAAQA